MAGKGGGIYPRQGQSMAQRIHELAGERQLAQQEVEDALAIVELWTLPEYRELVRAGIEAPGMDPGIPRALIATAYRILVHDECEDVPQLDEYDRHDLRLQADGALQALMAVERKEARASGQAKVLVSVRDSAVGGLVSHAEVPGDDGNFFYVGHASQQLRKLFLGVVPETMRREIAEAMRPHSTEPTVLRAMAVSTAAGILRGVERMGAWDSCRLLLKAAKSCTRLIALEKATIEQRGTLHVVFDVDLPPDPGAGDKIPIGQ